ncbi:hypothetical protein J5893_00825 [bacterium]|nr:hypothetical protein [bacterium]
MNDSITTLQSNIAEKKEIYEALKSRIENNEHTQELKNEIENYNKDAQKINNEAKQLELDVQENNKKLEQAINNINKILENNQENTKSQSDKLKQYNQRAAKNINLMLNDAKFKDFWEKNNNTPEKSQIEKYCGEYIKNANIPSEEKKYLEALSPNIVSFLVSNKEDIKYGKDLKVDYDNNDFKINGVSQTLENLKGKYAKENLEKEIAYRPNLKDSVEDIKKENFAKIQAGDLSTDLKTYIDKIANRNTYYCYQSENYIICSSMGDNRDKGWTYIEDTRTGFGNLYHTKSWSTEDEENEAVEGRKIFEPNTLNNPEDPTYHNYYPIE